MISYCSLLLIGFVRRGHPKLNFKMHVCYTLTQPGFCGQASRLLPYLGTTTTFYERKRGKKERERESWFMESNYFVLLLYERKNVLIY
jgi:hypothetical protein